MKVFIKDEDKDVVYIDEELSNMFFVALSNSDSCDKVIITADPSSSGEDTEDKVISNLSTLLTYMRRIVKDQKLFAILVAHIDQIVPGCSNKLMEYFNQLSENAKNKVTLSDDDYTMTFSVDNDKKENK